MFLPCCFLLLCIIIFLFFIPLTIIILSNLILLFLPSFPSLSPYPIPVHINSFNFTPYPGASPFQLLFLLSLSFPSISAFHVFYEIFVQRFSYFFSFFPISTFLFSQSISSFTLVHSFQTFNFLSLASLSYPRISSPPLLLTRAFLLSKSFPCLILSSQPCRPPLLPFGMCTLPGNPRAYTNPVFDALSSILASLQ